MEKPSRFLAPLLATVALTSADNARADVPAPAMKSSSTTFCEELRSAKGPEISDHITYFLPDYRGIEMTIKRAIRAVTEDGKEVTLSCTYDASKDFWIATVMSEKIPVESFSKDLFSPNGPAMSLTATTPNAEYRDDDMDGFPDKVSITSTLPDVTTRGVPCVEGQAPDICEELGVGLDDFDAAIAAGRKALNAIGGK